MQKQITNFEIRTMSPPKGSRLVFRSRSVKLNSATGEPVTDKKGEYVILSHTCTGRRPHRGKRLTRFMKRVKVKAMKSLGHFKGDNRPANEVIAKG